MDRAFAYLADPRNRPAWQSSLRRIAVLRPGDDGTFLGVGTSWTDITVIPGVRPRLRTTGSDRPNSWAEVGQWGPFRAELELSFAPSADGSRVGYAVTVRGAGLGGVLGRIGAPAIVADLRCAATMLVDGTS